MQSLIGDTHFEGGTTDEIDEDVLKEMRRRSRLDAGKNVGPSDTTLVGIDEMKEHDEIFQNMTARHYCDTR